MMIQALTVALLLSTPSVAAGPFASTGGKDRQASVVMVLGMPSQAGFMAYPPVEDLIKSTPIAGVAAARIFGVSPERYHQVVDVVVRVQRMQQSMQVTLSVALDAEDSARVDLAESYLVEVVRRFRDLLAEVKSSQLNGLRLALDTAKGKLSAARQKQDDVRDRLKTLRATPGLEGMSPAEIINASSNLRMNIRSYETTLATLRSRSSRADSADRGDSPAYIEPVIEAWQAVVNLRQERLEELRQAAEQGSVSDVDIAEFEARLAEAKAALLTCSQPAGQGAAGLGFGGARRPARIARPVASAMNIEQVEAQLSEAEEDLEQLSKVDSLRIAREMLELEAEENNLKTQISPLEGEVYNLERSFNMLELTTLEIIGEESLAGLSAPD